MYEHGSRQWIDVPSRMYSHLAPVIPGIGSGSRVTLTKINCLLKMNDSMMNEQTDTEND